MVTVPNDPAAGHDPAVADRPSRSDRLAAWLLRGPLAAAVALLCVVQLVTWVPHYLTWPWFADHDVFATAAQAWDAGQKPYRDIYGNNFPGTIYLFWVLGKLFGWGKTPALFAADALLVAAVGALMVAWSRRRFGRVLPGAVGVVTWLGYYLSLDYSQVAQRDWHGPCFAVAAILIVQAWPGRAGRIASALAMATALVIRPQPVLLMPALVLALAGASAERREPPGRVALHLLEWGLACGVFLALAFAPIAWAGVLGDFVRGVRLAAYGGNYNKASLASFVKEWLIQVAPLRVVAVLAAIGLLAGRAGRADRRAAVTWLVAVAGVLLYKPISPLPHAYLSHPLMLVWSVCVAVLVELVLASCARERGADRPDDPGAGERAVSGSPSVSPALGLVIVLLILGLGATGRPRFCNPRASLAALRFLWQGEDPDVAPLGYTHNPDVGKSAVYPWDDYRALLHYLRTEVPPSTRVANALKGVPAVTGPAGRLPAFPAESIAWLYMVKHDDEPTFAQALAETPDSVVVWSPAEENLERNFTLELLRPVILRLYEPAARFGIIEVWRRKTEPAPGPQAAAGPRARPGRSGAVRVSYRGWAGQALSRAAAPAQGSGSMPQIQPCLGPTREPAGCLDPQPGSDVNSTSR